MLYKQLQRITEIDKHIHKLHEQLADYYAERARLTDGKSFLTPPPNATVTDVPFVSTTDPHQLYEQLHATWLANGIKLPTFKTLQKRLTHAATIIDTLVSGNSQLENNLYVIAVPPTKQFNTLLHDAASLPHDYVFSEDYQQTKLKTRSAWTIVVVSGLDFSLPVETLTENLGQNEFTYKNYDCRALGVHEIIAADIQGIDIMIDNNWTLLLKDATDATYVPCVTKQGNTVVFDIDDTRCLLGNNYLQPAIAA